MGIPIPQRTMMHTTKDTDTAAQTPYTPSFPMPTSLNPPNDGQKDSDVFFLPNRDQCFFLKLITSAPMKSNTTMARATKPMVSVVLTLDGRNSMTT